VEIVKRPDDPHTFKVLPRRWVMERTLAWITRSRHTIRACERLPAHHETMVHWPVIIIVTTAPVMATAGSAVTQLFAR
jgi:transposase